MKKRIFVLLILVLSLHSIGFSQIEISKEGQKYYYMNPIITGMNPDPSICRVGEDYYLVTSTFGFFPGLPIYHSRDLVNWQLISYGISRPSQLHLRSENSDQLNLFAATIRYHDGTFYIINTNTGRRSDSRNFVITATNPAGPWSDAHYIENAPLIDPSLFFDDDGKVYYTGNLKPENRLVDKGRNIWTQEIDPKTWKLLGNRVDVIDCNDYYAGLAMAGVESTFLNNFEGPHLYKKDGQYYLIVSHGGTSWNHAVSIWKSDKVFGPFEFCPKNPIVTNRGYPHDNYIHHTGHADLVQTQNNEWFMVLLGSRPYGGEFTNLGRETNLVPVDWSGEWPVINPLGSVGRVMPFHRKPNLPAHPWPEKDARDNFDGESLGLDWNFIQTPLEQWWKLKEPSGQLKINLRPEIIENKVNPSFIGRRVSHKNFRAITKMKFSPQTESEVSGMVITRDVNNHFQLVSVLKQEQQYIRLIRNDAVNDSVNIIAEQPFSGKVLYLKMEALEQLFSFSYSADGKQWNILAENVDARFLSLGLGIAPYTGTFVGMYASSNGKKSTNNALFDWFEYSGF